MKEIQKDNQTVYVSRSGKEYDNKWECVEVDLCDVADEIQKLPTVVAVNAEDVKTIHADTDFDVYCFVPKTRKEIDLLREAAELAGYNRLPDYDLIGKPVCVDFGRNCEDANIFNLNDHLARITKKITEVIDKAESLAKEN